MPRAGAGAVAAAVVLAAGCGGATATTHAGGCVPVPAALREAIRRHVVLAHARLGRARAVRSDEAPSLYYVSVSLAGDGARRLLATWATRSLAGRAPIYAVDANAVLVSRFGSSAASGAGARASLRSRRCVTGR